MFFVGCHCVFLDGVNWASHVTVLSQTADKSEATHIIHKPTGTGVKLQDIDVVEVDKSWRFSDNFDDLKKVCLTNGQYLKVVLYDLVGDIDYYKNLDQEITKHYGSEDWMQNFGSEMAVARKAAKDDFAAKKEELVAAAKEAGVDLTNTPAKKRRTRG